VIDVQGLSKTFRVHQKQAGLKASVKSLFVRDWIEKKALDSVSMKIEAGEIVGLIGANGAGKTTLVKLLSGIVHPTSGEAFVLGHRPWLRENNFRRQMALIMGQKAQLWWDLPAADCFILLKEIYQIPDARYKETLDFLISTLDVRAELNIQIRRLSLGERMKMELIAALLHQPKVVFLDEPTIGLDLTAQKAIREFILHYRQLHKPAMILTSHYMEDIERLCERVIIMREGRFVYDGPLKSIISQYAQHKVLTLQLQPDFSPKWTSVQDFPTEWGQLISSEAGQLKIQVQRDQVADSVGALLHKLPIKDISIEEPDIGSIIEALIRRERPS
jgi:ABC-2 type transport system ATP-binding protein